MICYYCFHELGWKPSDYIKLPAKEKAVIAALVEIRSDIIKKNNKK